MGLATKVGRAIFPTYDAVITPKFVGGMNGFARDLGILDRDVPYDAVVATQFRAFWTG